MSHFQAPFSRVNTALAYLCQTDDFMANLHACLIKQATHKCIPCRWRCEAAVNPTKAIITLAQSRKGKWGKEGKGQKTHSEQERPYAGLPKLSECKSSPNVAHAPHRCTLSSTAHSLFSNIKANERAAGVSLWARHVACMHKCGDIIQK